MRVTSWAAMPRLGRVVILLTGVGIVGKSSSDIASSESVAAWLDWLAERDRIGLSSCRRRFGEASVSGRAGEESGGDIGRTGVSRIC